MEAVMKRPPNTCDQNDCNKHRILQLSTSKKTHLKSQNSCLGEKKNKYGSIENLPKKTYQQMQYVRHGNVYFSHESRDPSDLVSSVNSEIILTQQTCECLTDTVEM